jgi:hypothetical protein
MATVYRSPLASEALSALEEDGLDVVETERHRVSRALAALGLSKEVSVNHRNLDAMEVENINDRSPLADPLIIEQDGSRRLVHRDFSPTQPS